MGSEKFETWATDSKMIQQQPEEDQITLRFDNYGIKLVQRLQGWSGQCLASLVSPPT